MFRRNRERFERLERQLEGLAEAVRDLKTPSRAEAGETFAKLLGTTLESQSNMFASLGEIAVRSAARRAGIKGGTQRARTAERRQNGQFLPKQQRRDDRFCCELGRNPMTRDVTIPMIIAHREHEAEARAREMRNEQSVAIPLQSSEAAGGAESGLANGAIPTPGTQPE